MRAKSAIRLLFTRMIFPREINRGSCSMFVRLMIDGQQSRPFSGITIPPAPTRGPPNPRKVRL